MFHKILVPLDGSELAERAITTAYQVATLHEAEIVLLHVSEPVLVTMPDLVVGVTNPYMPMAEEPRYVQQAYEYLNGVKHRLANKRKIEISTMVVEGDAAGCIVDTAVEGVDLIVMSTHGRSGLSRWFLGSITEKVIQRASCPVLVVRHDRPYRNVIVTLDGSELGEHALKPGIMLAEAFKAKLTFLHILEPTADVAEAAIARVGQIEPRLGVYLDEQLRQNAQTYLDGAATNCPVEKDTVVLKDNAAEGILRYVRNRDVDLVVMATHGRSGLRHFLLGSVTERIVRYAPCDVLVVR